MAPGVIEGGRPVRRVALAASSALAGATIGAGWAAAAFEFTGKLSGDAQVIAIQFLGLVIVIAEVGVILIALQTVRTHAAAGRPREADDIGPDSENSAP